MQYDMEELLEQSNEVQESLSRSYAVPDEIDEADLEAGAPFPCTGSAESLAEGLNAELDALGMEEEEEGGSYLADLNKAPDFIDEAPIEASEVRHL
jgi:charged multivesicular body protein 5